MKFLTTSNYKALKGLKKGYSVAVLHFAPASLSGYNVCPKSTPGCRAACLNTAGHGAFDMVQTARIKKTKLFFEDRANFMGQIVKDIESHVKLSEKKDLIPCIRLNATSDIRWETIPCGSAPNVMALFPDLQFYDYTKLPNRKGIPSNYHLTFSLSEKNETDARRMLDEKIMNVGAVFKERPKTWWGYRVKDGDEDDLRFLDPKGIVLCLLPKGRAKRDTSGFVIDINAAA